MSSAQHSADNSLSLRDIHLPEPISWWPPAPGWWLLLAVLLIVAISLMLWWRSWHNKRVLRQLQQQMEQLKQSHQDTHDAAATIKQLSVLLRRACISYFPRQNIASLTGEQWLAFLDDASGQAFNTDTGRLLINAPYQANAQIENSQLDALLQISGNALNGLHDKGKRQ